MKIEKAAYANFWLVLMPGYELTFRSMEEATQFADRLRERLNAPHQWPVHP